MGLTQPLPRYVLADSHVHLDRYSERAVAAMLERARHVGVQHVLAVGVDAASSAAAINLASRAEGVLAAVGVHPTRVGAASTVDGLRELAGRPGVVAIGEVGLDDTAPAELLPAQTTFFGACLKLAAELDLALALHVVGAHQRAQQLLISGGPVRAVVHYFQGDFRLAQAYLDLGCSISVGKPVTRPDRVALREAVRGIPLDRLLCETDTYPLPGRSTEPRDVVEVCRAVAEVRRVEFETVAEATTANYLRLFGSRSTAR